MEVTHNHQYGILQLQYIPTTQIANEYPEVLEANMAVPDTSDVVVAWQLMDEQGTYYADDPDTAISTFLTPMHTNRGLAVEHPDSAWDEYGTPLETARFFRYYSIENQQEDYEAYLYESNIPYPVMSLSDLQDGQVHRVLIEYGRRGEQQYNVVTLEMVSQDEFKRRYPNRTTSIDDPEITIMIQYSDPQHDYEAGTTLYEHAVKDYITPLPNEQDSLSFWDESSIRQKLTRRWTTYYLLDGTQEDDYEAYLYESNTASIKADALAHRNVGYIVPSDAHGHTEDNIITLDGFSRESTKEAVKDCISAAHGESALHGLGFHLPFITIGFAAYRNYRQVREYGKDSEVAIKHTIIESVGRGTGVVAGAKAGALVGSIGGHIGMIIGAITMGIIGAVIGRNLAEEWKRKPLNDAIRNFDSTLTEFEQSFKPRVSIIKETIKAPLKRMGTTYFRLANEANRRTRNWKYIVWPDFYSVLLKEAENIGYKAIREEKDKLDKTQSVIDRMCTNGEWRKFGMYMANAPGLCAAVGYDPKLFRNVMSARRRVHKERKNLNPKIDLPD